MEALPVGNQIQLKMIPIRALGPVNSDEFQGGSTSLILLTSPQEFRFDEGNTCNCSAGSLIENNTNIDTIPLHAW